jgi:hypothetical protein
MRAKRVDGNQADIVDALRDIGCLVAITSALGNGFPDVVVAWRGKIYLVEIKDGSLPPSGRKLTTAEENFHERWAGYVHIVNSVDEALQLIGVTP